MSNKPPATTMPAPSLPLAVRVDSVLRCWEEEIENDAKKAAARTKGGQQCNDMPGTWERVPPNVRGQLRWWFRAIREQLGGAIEGMDSTPEDSKSKPHGYRHEHCGDCIYETLPTASSEELQAREAFEVAVDNVKDPTTPENPDVSLSQAEQAAEKWIDALSGESDAPLYWRSVELAALVQKVAVTEALENKP